MSEGVRGEVRLEAVSKRYGGVTAVNQISILITPGQLASLVGPSGCGKTTTLRLIAGLELASTGRISIGGRDVTKTAADGRDVAMVFQSYALFPHLTVTQNVSYGLLARGSPRVEAKKKAEAGLELVGLLGLETRLPSELSGGQQQRVALARALVLEPEVLLFDEPLSNLDARLRRRMRLEIRQIQQRLGITAVYVTHDRDDALSISDRVIVMDKAEVLQEGAPKELYERPANLFVAQFLGEANVLLATVERTSGSASARIKAEGLELSVESCPVESGPACLLIRPEALSLHPPKNESPGSAAPNTPSLAGEIKSAAYLGDRWEYEVSTGAGDLLVITRAQPAGSDPAVTLYIDPDGVVVVPR